MMRTAQRQIKDLSLSDMGIDPVIHRARAFKTAAKRAPFDATVLRKVVVSARSRSVL
jgi:hypothetical protein